MIPQTFDLSLSNLFLLKSSLHVYVILFFSFLSKNKFIEPEIQKGFTPKISGVLEHTFMMASIIDKARIKQRLVVITLLDLKNAFGEVHYNLIRAVLNHHHVPPTMQAIISNLYDNFQTFINLSSFICLFMNEGWPLSGTVIFLCTFLEQIQKQQPS